MKTPNIGDKCDGSAIGKKRDQWIFAGCVQCGAGRWLRLWDHEHGRRRLCRVCQLKRQKVVISKVLGGGKR